MTASRGFTTNDLYNGVNFRNFDDIQQPRQKFSPIELRPDNLEYENYSNRNEHRHQVSEP